MKYRISYQDLEHTESPRFDFHVSISARRKYLFDESLYSITGNLIIADARKARLLADNINKIRKTEGKTDLLITAGMINALGLLHEIFHFLIRYYEEKVNPGVLARGINFLKSGLSEESLNLILIEFINEFPPFDVYKGKVSAEDYLNGYTGAKSNREVILEEIILLNLANSNPATIKLEELYSDQPLVQKTRYTNLLEQTEKFFINEKYFEAENLPLIQFLKKPIISSPHSLDGQLDYIINKWGVYVYEKFHERILKAKDLIYEDARLFFHGGFDKPTPPVPTYDKDYFEKLRAKLAAGERLTEDESRFYHSEIERFTPDIDWMPKVVMIAKNIYVWLDQISKKYNRPITRLDQIPDEEIDLLARWNFTSIWLIGIWERSSASKKIKHIMGNIDAVASAYSLYDYVIAYELGGEDAFQNFKGRAWDRGIRVSSDMVPNHMGIYSKWVIEKPGYFIQTDYPPFPGYTFTGPNLSEDHRVEIRIEDKYYNRTDAAVVFQRRDSYTGDIKYIYHGNDGTHMPWNDTAQLNLLNPEVRESLIQTIMHVARKTPIIRFDAAMTLAKKHYQRLWFPRPGTGGAIPSRSDFSMNQVDFDRAIPEEFWREVVDRINAEMPNTLLLAEAFWLMEGYFVRTLGMHRVYNSAFMHMMMKEENEKYKMLIKNTLEFNPEILKRYVNFMSNPDEETAVNQFGKGDKYFGVAVMMVTMPGLPLFGHGQIEGFSEKYGMEYKRSYYDEFVDGNLVSRHEHEIFPLMQKRYLFSQVENFELYDFIDNYGNVNENVFAYSNRLGNDIALIIYNNSYSECKGTIKYSAQKISSNGHLSNKKLAEALGLKWDDRIFYGYRDHRTNFEFLISGRDIHDSGLYLALNGYEYRACLNFREIFDFDGSYRKLYYHLSGRGVYSLEQELREMNLMPLHQSITEYFTPQTFEELHSYIFEEKSIEEKLDEVKEKINEDTAGKINNILNHLDYVTGIPAEREKISAELKKDLEAGRKFNQIWKKQISKKSVPGWLKEADETLTIRNGEEKRNTRNLFITALLLNRIMNTNGKDSTDSLFERLLLGKPLHEVLKNIGHHEEKIGHEIHLLKILTSKDKSHIWDISTEDKPDKGKKKVPAIKKADEKTREEIIVTDLLKGDDIKYYLLINEFEGITYYNKERLDNILEWLFTLSCITKTKLLEEKTKRSTGATLLKEFEKLYQSFSKIKETSNKSGYNIEKFKTSFSKATTAGPRVTVKRVKTLSKQKTKPKKRN